MKTQSQTCGAHPRRTKMWSRRPGECNGAASDNEYPYTTQSFTGETPVPRWLRGMTVPAMIQNLNDL